MSKAALFNRLYAIGTPVTIPREGAETFGRFQTVTVSEAKAIAFDTAAICVEGVRDPVDLDQIEIDFERAPQLRGRTIEQVEREETLAEEIAQARARERKEQIARTIEAITALEATITEQTGIVEKAEKYLDEQRINLTSSLGELQAHKTQLETLKASA